MSIIKQIHISIFKDIINNGNFIIINDKLGLTMKNNNIFPSYGLLGDIVGQIMGQNGTHANILVHTFWPLKIKLRNFGQF